jgi:hypothetical protein
MNSPTGPTSKYARNSITRPARTQDANFLIKTATDVIKLKLSRLYDCLTVKGNDKFKPTLDNGAITTRLGEIIAHKQYFHLALENCLAIS